MLRIAIAYLVLSRRLDILKSSLFAFVSVRSEGIDLEFRHGSYQKRALRGILPPIQSCKWFTLSRDMSNESQKFCFFQLAHFPGYLFFFPVNNGDWIYNGCPRAQKRGLEFYVWKGLIFLTTKKNMIKFQFSVFLPRVS